FFSYGLLLQFELSNGVLVFVLMIIWFVYRPKFKRVEVGKAISGLLLGIAPFLIYDFTHRFAQTLGFPLWIVNRIRLAFGLTVFGNATTTHVPHAIDTIWQQISRIVFPDSQTVFVLILLLCLFVLFKTKKQFLKRVPQKGVFLTLLWLIVPIVGYSVHAAPGSAYFPLLFVPISLLVGYTAFHFISKTKFILVLFLALCFFNAFYTVKYNYFLSFDHFKGERAPGWNYSLGAAFIEREQAVSFIKQDAKSQKVTIKSGGFLRQFATGVDNYKYLLWYNGVKTAQNTKVVYTIYEQQSDVPKNANLVYRNGFVYVTKMAIL
ncbi:MAG TPA: hypothetical protein VLF68_01885, partial [Candidatus Saccharimonadales bacterium]|nr:hypothetical protein [Candidatus Saccharimonadales bacterium]